jgi:WhiB family transcriptional regulator, redox-sensing transcriptional regulator
VRWEGAVCADHDDPDLWFDLHPARVTVAKQHCAPCPVRDDCLDYAVTQRVDYGVWGGLSADERRTMIRRHQRAASAARRTRTVG